MSHILQFLVRGRIFHPTDFSETSRGAFVHALKLAVLTGARLTLFHVEAKASLDQDWHRFPSVHRTLADWGLTADIEASGLPMEVEKLVAVGPKIVETLAKHAVGEPTGLLVLGRELGNRMSRWLGGPVAEALAREVKLPTLFVPEGGRGFVSATTGRVELERILVPVAVDPDPKIAVQGATDMAALADTETEILALHVGAKVLEVDPGRSRGDSAPVLRTALCAGERVGQIVAVSEAETVRLVVMSSHGRDGLMDHLRGSTTERVLRRLRCPLLTLPR